MDADTQDPRRPIDDADPGTDAPTEVMPIAETQTGDPDPDDHHPHHDRRRLLIVAGGVVVILVAAAIALTRGDDGDETSTSDTSSSATASTTPTTATTSTDPTTPSSGAPATTATPGVTNPAPSTSPTSDMPGEGGAYTGAAFAAWQHGDRAALEQLATPEVVAFLLAHEPDTDGWTGPQNEGAAGSTYSTWTRADVQLVLRLGNEAARNGEPHAVIGAFFQPAPGRLALWPVATTATANDLQAQVDDGHQPWLLDPAAVANAYVEATYGWTGATVEETSPAIFLVTDPAAGTVASLHLTQPARSGADGIWAVDSDGSVTRR